MQALRLDATQWPSISDLSQRLQDRLTLRLGARPIPTQTCSVIFDASVSSSLIQHFLQAISGQALVRKSSFLQETIGQQVWHPSIDIMEYALLPKQLGSCPFDAEGVRT